MRHYYASVLLDGGESIRTVSDRLDHADPGLTLRSYTHLLPDTETRTRTIVDDVLRTLSTPNAGQPDQTAVRTGRDDAPTRPRRALGPIR